MWSRNLLPLKILYSPLLRLRFRSAVASCVDQINTASYCCILLAPIEAPRTLAVDIEHLKHQPPTGTIYVKDSEARKATRGNIEVFKVGKDNLSSAIIRLPESEDSPFNTTAIALQELCHLLGIRENDEIEQQSLTLDDVALLLKLYNR